MEIIIGRDAATSKLNIIVEDKPNALGDPNSVPHSVSRQHCSILIDEEGAMRIKNLNPQNVTYVNGMAVVEKSVTREDRVELGADRYPLDWKLVDKAIPKIVDVRKLKDVWEGYNKSTKAITQSTQRFQVIRSIVPVFTMSAVLIGYLSGGRGGAFYLIYLLVIGLTLFFSFKAWRDIAKNDARKEQVKDTFTRDYCCPGCGYFFGFTDFRILSKNMDKCPKCKAKLLK